MIKAAVNVISEPLALILNQVMEKGIHPDKLKYSQISPIFKKGQKTDINNYRPISVLSNLSKVFEKIINFRLVNYFESNNIFYNKQFGFRKNVSTNSALIQFINEITDALDKSHATAGVFCDLSKAFDCVNHSVLVSKLMDYQIKGSCIALIESYLSKRMQRTIILENNIKHFSAWENTSIGVPQGSILGPLFFLIYINDLPKSINNELILFTDDTTAIIKNKLVTDLPTHISNVMEDMEKWFTINGLKLNLDKTQIIKFSARKSNNDEINFFPNLVQSSSFLGIELDESISWKVQLNKINNKIRSQSYVFFHLRECVSVETIKVVYFAYVESILRYGIVLWGQAAGITSVLRLQKRIIRVMTNSHPRSNCKPLFKKLSILTVVGLYIFEILAYMHTIKNHIPETLRFQHSYNTRNGTNFRLPNHRLTIFEKSPLYAGLRLYNELPTTYKSLSPDQFRTKLKNELIARSPYSMQECYQKPLL